MSCTAHGRRRTENKQLNTECFECLLNVTEASKSHDDDVTFGLNTCFRFSSEADVGDAGGGRQMHTEVGVIQRSFDALTAVDAACTDVMDREYLQLSVILRDKTQLSYTATCCSMLNDCRYADAESYADETMKTSK